MSEVLWGRPVQQEIVSRLLEKKQHPRLSIIQVGHNPRSDVYIAAKKRFAEKVGAQVEHIRLEEELGEGAVLDAISVANSDSEAHGIIVQLPLPVNFDREKILQAIDPRKDVDGLTDKSRFTPATALAVQHLLRFYHIEVAGRQVVVMGRSRLVGSPVARLLGEMGGEVTVIHRETRDPKIITTKADILIVAIGQPELVDESFLKEGQIIIDVGIHESERGGEKVLLGDVKREAKEKMASQYSPVPGGVGPLTVASLFENLFTARENLVQ